MAIIFVTVYGACFIGMWFLLKSLMQAWLKDRYKSVHLLLAYLAIAPFLIIGLGFLAISVIPMEI